MATKGKTSKNVRRADKADIDTSGMAETSIQVLMLGLDLGWEPMVMRNGVLRITREHDGRAVAINLPTNQRSIKEAVARSWMRKVITYGDPIRLELIRTAYENLHSPNDTEKVAAEAFIRGLRSTEVYKNPAKLAGYIGMEEGGTVQDFVDREQAKLEQEIGEMADAAVAEVQSILDGNGVQPLAEDSEPDAPVDATVPRVTKVKPWTAKHSISSSGARTYESKAVLERKWSDGSIDYLCAYPDCDFTHPSNPRSVTAHYGSAHPEKPAAVAYEEVHKDPDTRWTPTERQQGRIRRLANELQAAANEIGESMTTYECAEWIVKHRDEARDRHLEDESTPLTADQIVDRIRTLVDRGVYADLLARIDDVQMQAAAQVAQARADCEQMRAEMTRHDTGATNAVRTLEQRLREMEEQTRVAEAAEQAALAAARESEGKWRALRDLINE